MTKILVIGSMNMDLIIQADRYPQKGETIIGGNFQQVPGGKGANQALAAAKLNGDVEFIGACGNDDFASKIKSSLKSGGVKTNNIFKILNINTGVAVITVDKKGNNRIIVSPGANYKLDENKVNKIKDKIIEAEYILLQLEIPIDTVKKIIKIAYRNNTKIILDPAPAVRLSDYILEKVDYLIPNEGELDLLLGENNKMNRSEKIQTLLEKGVKNVIVTKGEKGVKLHNKNENFFIRSLKVKAVDTTAAGDVFAGAFVNKLSTSNNVKEALKFAVIAAAYSVTKSGAQSSVPTLNQVKTMQKNNSMILPQKG
jgi:ribokinase